MLAISRSRLMVPLLGAQGSDVLQYSNQTPFGDRGESEFEQGGLREMRRESGRGPVPGGEVIDELARDGGERRVLAHAEEDAPVRPCVGERGEPQSHRTGERA